MASVFDRYGKFREDGTNYIVPFCSIKESETDKYVTYRKGRTRLDNVSYEIYGTPDYDWLILQANPEYGSMEFEIKDGAILRIPFPLIDTLAQYNNDIANHKKGIN